MSIRERDEDAHRMFGGSPYPPGYEPWTSTSVDDRRALLQAGDALAKAVEWQHAIHKDKRIGEGCVACAAAARWRAVVDGPRSEVTDG